MLDKNGERQNADTEVGKRDQVESFSCCFTDFLSCDHVLGSLFHVFRSSIMVFFMLLDDILGRGGGWGGVHSGDMTSLPFLN